jgi:hypothetical protein
MRTIKQLNAITGTLSKPSKMPCAGTSTPAKDCNVGSYLRTVEGSVCAGCYAFERGNYAFSNVQAGLQNRLDKIGGPEWAPAMAEYIRRRCTTIFRWHDSGDIQNMGHLRDIVTVAQSTPHITHWIPTKEYALVLRYLRHGATFPDNLRVRVSAPMIGPAFGPLHADSKVARLQEQFQQLVLMFDMPYSTVDDDGAEVQCGASENNGECGDCRACWSTTKSVNYHKH